MGTITRSFANNITSGGTFDATDLTGTIPASNIADASVTNITAVPALTAVSTVASDPPSPDAGQIWYNTTDKALRAYVLGAGAWATGGNMNLARERLTGAGITTAALAIGGEAGTVRAEVESYDGTTWTEVNDLNTAKRLTAAAGSTNTAVLAFGGAIAPTAQTATTEDWDGASWTEVNDLNSARQQLAGTGTNTSALGIGGNEPGTGITPKVESWNGTSWTEVGDINTQRLSLAATGIQTAALAFGGDTPPQTAVTESWNGSAWTEVNDLNTARQRLAGAGTQTSTLAFGGTTPNTGATEEWNGTSWTETTDLSTARNTLAGDGVDSTSAIAFGGNVPPVQAATEEWTKTEVVTDLGAS